MNMLKTIGADDKKKLIALGGLVAFVILVMVYLFVIRKAPTPAATPVNPIVMNPGEPGMPGIPGGASAVDTSAPAGGGGGGSVTAVSLASLSGFRGDPFTPEYVIPAPPPPPPPRPIPLPMPEALPTPSPNYPAGLPPAFIAANSPSTVLVGLPPIEIPRMARAATKPQQFEAPKQVGGTYLATPSFNKRLSGVIIGDSVHALLEVSNASGTQTYVVQPGDTIAGMRILGIQRVEVGGRTVPRMLISENGEQKYVELRPAFSAQTDQQPGGAGGIGGLPGNPGAFPGNPTIFPAPSMRPGQQVGRGDNPFSAN